ncbi:ABC transporter substrate-binding protein [Arthrobacter sp. TMS1-12-1]
MPEAVDVGSVLGGRYKVTGYVLASAEKDLVLDGVDQVLNRAVSILVASPGNAAQVATSARELATGDRSGNIQVLDLGITDSGTYLVTNRAPAADMLDLIVQQDAPYVEPFFTDTLGSEIFGRPRSTEPETYDDDDHFDDYDDDRQQRPSRLAGLARRFSRRTSGDAAKDDTSDLPPVTAGSAVAEPVAAQSVAAQPVSGQRSSSHRVPPPPSRRPGGASSAGSTDASREDTRDGTGDGNGGGRLGAAAVAAGAGAVGAASATGAASVGSASPTGTASPADADSPARAASPARGQKAGRAASMFPLSTYSDEDDRSSGSDDPDEFDTEQTDRDDDDSGGLKFTRILVGTVLTVVLVVAVVLAATHLGSVFSGGSPVADAESTPSVSAPADSPTTAAPAATPSAEPTPAAVTPAIAGITRLVPDNPGLDAGNDGTLPLIIDGNPATFWGNQVYASDTFGGLATNLALVVELEEESTITEVSIDQLNAAGGTFSVLVNDRPTLDGAEQIAQGGFTAPTADLPIPAGADGPVTGKYVIINFTQLPRLSDIQAQFPFGLRIAEITVS